MCVDKLEHVSPAGVHAREPMTHAHAGWVHEHINTGTTILNYQDCVYALCSPDMAAAPPCGLLSIVVSSALFFPEVCRPLAS